MGETTGISWADHTFNPWWGCEKVSPACTHCYAETFSRRVGLRVWGAETERRFFGEKHWNEPRRWNAQAQRDGVRRRVFCASMADVFEDRPDLDPHRDRLWNLIIETPQLDWLLLTKRPENIDGMVPWLDDDEPPLNVWLGTTVENQEYAALRVPLLLQAPAVRRFISYEPGLGELDLTNIRVMGHSLDALRGEWCAHESGCLVDDKGDGAIDWVIAGGESGGHARPSHPDWFRAVRDQCQAAGAAYHFKQWGEWGLGSGYVGRMSTERVMLRDGRSMTWEEYRAAFSQTPSELDPTMISRVGKKAAGRLLDGREWNEFPEGR